MIEVDPDRLLAAVKGSSNTLWGWLRRMEGYEDEVLKKSLTLAYLIPDPRERLDWLDKHPEFKHD